MLQLINFKNGLPKPSKHLLAALIAGMFTLMAWGTASAQNSPLIVGPSTAPMELETDRIIVKYKPGNRASRRLQLSQANTNALSARAGSTMRHIRRMKDGAHVFKLDRFRSAAAVRAMAQQIKADPAVEYAEPDLILQPAFVPNDTYYSQYQWHYFETAGGINLPPAWDISTGVGVTVAVIDTGYLPHADLVANILPGYDMISNATTARDGDGRDADPTDMGDWVSAGECGNGIPAQDTPSSWHGTHVAGTIAAETNNNQGVAGVAFDAQILPVRALGRCGGYTSDIADAIIWAAGGSVSGVPANTTPAQVINLSLGGSGSCLFTFQDAVNTANNLGATVVVAAGNSNSNASNFTPANCNNVVAVAATDRNGSKASYSNFGSVVDVAAPGGQFLPGDGSGGVLSTLNNGQTTAGDDAYAFFQGTSMAAPHVSGVAALLYSQDPTITPQQVESTLSNTTRSFPGACSQCGTGIVDAHAALLGDPGAGGGGEATELENGVIVSGLSGNVGDELRFTLDVPEDASNLSFVLAGGFGDADLYVQFGSEPTPSSFECGSYQVGNGETCVINNVQAGTYHVLVHAYSAFSGAELLATFDEGGGNVETFSVSNLSGFWFSWLYYFVEIPEGTESLEINTFGGTGDADLYLRYGDLPNTGAYNCVSGGFATAETCTIENPTPGTWYIGVRSGFFYSGVSMTVQYTY